MPGAKPHARRRAKKPRLFRAVALGIALTLILAVAATAIPVLLFAAIAPPTTAFMLLSRVADPATGRSCDVIDYEWLELDSIAPDLGLAVIVSEDQRFFEHSGFDLHAITQALSDKVDGGRLRGASTISQQVAKNLFLWPGRSLTRKILEAWFTAWLERVWSKRRILEVYLNIAVRPLSFRCGSGERSILQHRGHRADASRSGTSRHRASQPEASARRRSGTLRDRTQP